MNAVSDFSTKVTSSAHVGATLLLVVVLVAVVEAVLVVVAAVE